MVLIVLKIKALATASAWGAAACFFLHVGQSYFWFFGRYSALVLSQTSGFFVQQNKVFPVKIQIVFAYGL
jgi:H+/gluconate symporter-like permease